MVRDVCPLEGGEPWPPLILFNLTIKNLAWIQQWFMIRDFSLIEKTIQLILGIPFTFLKVILWNQEFQTGAKTDPVLPCESYFRGGFSWGHRCTCPAPRQWLKVWVYPYYFITCQSPFSRRFHQEGAHLGTNAWESLYNTVQYKTNAWESLW